MQTIIRTKDNRVFEVTHTEPFTESERIELENMTFRRLFHVGSISGFVEVESV